MTVAQIKSMLKRQMSTHQSTLPVIEAIIEYLAEREAAQVPAASANPVAPESIPTAEAPAPPKAEAEATAHQEEASDRLETGRAISPIW